MLYREMIAVSSQIHTKDINTLWWQSVELLNVKLGGIWSDHRDLYGLCFIVRTYLNNSVCSTSGKTATPKLWKLIRLMGTVSVCFETQRNLQIVAPTSKYLIHENRACKYYYVLLNDAPSIIEYYWLSTHTAATHLRVIAMLSRTGSHQIITRQRRAGSYTTRSAVRTGVSSASVATAELSPCVTDSF